MSFSLCSLALYSNDIHKYEILRTKITFQQINNSDRCFMTLTHISRPPKIVCQSFQTYDNN